MNQPNGTGQEPAESSNEISSFNEEKAARRRVLQGVAWGVPAILLTSTAPAFATSKDNWEGEW